MKNQILSVDNSYKAKRAPKGNSNIEIKTIIRFFVIVLIIFSVGFIGMGTYAIAQNNGFGLNKPEATFERKYEKLLITATSENGLDKIVYVWSNSNEEKTIDLDGETYKEEEVELPVGNNTIKVTIYDINGKVATYEENYEIEALAPQLSIEGSNGKIKITAKDNEQMAYITYRWDESEEVEIEAKEDSLAQIEEEIEIPRGQHKLTVVAVNSRNLTTTKEQEVKGVTKPIISVVQDAEQTQYLILSVSDEEAIQKVQFNLNGKEYMIDLSDYKEKQIQYKIQMIEGENTITVTATNFDNAKSTFEGRCTYAP